jgi:hypothetical protein
MGEIIFDFFDQLKSRTKGYASLDYELAGELASDLVKVDILLQGEPVDAFSAIVHKDKAYAYGTNMTSKLRELIPRQNFEVPIQAAIGARSSPARTSAPSARTCWPSAMAVTSPQAQGLLEKQKEGKKRMKMVGRVEGPPGGVHRRAVDRPGDRQGLTARPARRTGRSAAASSHAGRGRAQPPVQVIAEWKEQAAKRSDVVVDLRHTEPTAARPDSDPSARAAGPDPSRPYEDLDAYLALPAVRPGAEPGRCAAGHHGRHPGQEGDPLRQRAVGGRPDGGPAGGAADPQRQGRGRSGLHARRRSAVHLRPAGPRRATATTRRRPPCGGCRAPARPGGGDPSRRDRRRGGGSRGAPGGGAVGHLPAATDTATTRRAARPARTRRSTRCCTPATRCATGTPTSVPARPGCSPQTCRSGDGGLTGAT